MIIARTTEIKQLHALLSSKQAEFLAVYGRRRVGKTHLIREFFAGKGLYFEITGMKNAKVHDQLNNFIEKFSACFYDNLPLRTIKTWHEAFSLLTNEIKKTPKNKKIILFMDELPWLASPRSGLIQALDYFWNTEWSKISNLKLIVCGSAAAWMLNHLINAKGGLHNRLTKSMLLQPLNLKQTKEFLLSQGLKLNNSQVLEIYLTMGGIPYYLKQLQNSKSVAQNIDELCFTDNAFFQLEFERLFRSLFDEHETHLKILEEINKARYGISRDNLLKKTKITSGGRFNQRITELEAAGFIKSFIPFGKKNRGVCYKVIDEYTSFFLKWIKPELMKGFSFASGYWQTKMGSPSWYAWSGYAFESVCLKHVEKIRTALGLEKIGCRIGNWRFSPNNNENESGAQIDLLFDRDDQAITLCEIKYSQKPFVIDKDQAKRLLKKSDIFIEKTKTEKQVFIALIASSGLKENAWSKDLIDANASLEDLFK